MKFCDVIGHSEIKAHLAQTIQNQRISHAQLLVAESGVGGLSLAVAYAQALLCRNRTALGDSCGQCPECYKMSRLEHPDCNFIFPVNRSKKAKATSRADDKPTSDQFIHLWREFFTTTSGYFTEQEWYQYIGLENQQGNINKEEATELLRKMSFKSFEGGYKIAIIWLPERMNATAANALLKLIEEPAEGTLFLLVSEDQQAIISTILSRTQIVTLSNIPQAVIAEQLTNTMPHEAAQRIAVAAQGSWRRAEILAASSENDPNYERFADLMRKCYNSKYLELFDWAEQMATLGREEQKIFCESAITILRQCYLTGINMPQLAYTWQEQEKFVRNFSPYVNHLSIESFISELELLLRQIRQNGNPKILFTHSALTISKILNHAKSGLTTGK